MRDQKHDRDAAVDRLLAGAMPRGSTEPSAECLDADTLAAWADQALTAGERAAAEAHAADCARCQAMLSAMVKTGPAPDSAASRWHLPSARWLVSMAAAAAAVLVWILVPARQSRVTVPQGSRVAQTSPPPPSPSRSESTGRPAEAAAPPAAATFDTQARREQRPAVKPDDLEADKKTRATPEANALADNLSRDDARVKPDADLERARPAAEAGVPASRAAAAAAHAAAPAAQLAAKAPSLGARETVIVSPNPGSRWRILQGGAVQRSSDGGSTWQVQSTGIGETLSAGTSPSASVCWLVGPSGIVLVSTDGLSWKRLVFPEAVPLVAVRATDDKAATVTTADGREFVTDDGGLTWARAPR